MNIREYLKNNILITDGAMGTYFDELYPIETELVEKVLLKNPIRIRKIHEEYLNAGARLIRTNSFAINPNFFEDRGEALDAARVSFNIAREAVDEFHKIKPGEEVYIAADIGTLFDMKSSTDGEDISFYEALIDEFLKAGAGIFLFETQADFSLLTKLVSYVKSKAPGAYVITTFSFDKTHYTKAGLKIDRMMRFAAECDDIDAYGMNCDMDSTHMRDAMKEFSYYTDKPFFALPNAGYPYILRGKPIFARNEEYWTSTVSEMIALGANALGGCCGTIPSHIKSLSDKISKEAFPVLVKNVHSLDSVEKRTFSEFYKKMERGEKAFIVELDPPADVDASKVMDGAKLLKAHDVDLLTLSDSPLARTRMDSSVLGSLVQKETGIQVMPHITCRDRNTIGLRGTMLGDYYAGLRHFLLITGDPVAKTDRGITTPVFDYNSIKFMSLIKEMNEDVFAKDTVVYGGALNYHGVNADAIAHRMELKMEQGCKYFLTQPIYSDEDIERIAYLKEKTGAKICAGIMPLVSHKNAVFMSNQMPGIKIPEKIVESYKEDMTREEAEDNAIRISTDIALKLKDIADAYYFMTPFNRVSLICNIIENIRQSL